MIYIYTLFFMLLFTYGIRILFRECFANLFGVRTNFNQGVGVVGGWALIYVRLLSICALFSIMIGLWAWKDDIFNLWKLFDNSEKLVWGKCLCRIVIIGILIINVGCNIKRILIHLKTEVIKNEFAQSILTNGRGVVLTLTISTVFDIYLLQAVLCVMTGNIHPAVLNAWKAGIVGKVILIAFEKLFYSEKICIYQNGTVTYSTLLKRGYGNKLYFEKDYKKANKARLYVDGEEVLETAFFNIDQLLKNYGKKNDEEVKSDAKVTGKKIHYMKSTKRNERTCRTIAISVGAALVLLGVLFYVFFASKVVMIVMWLLALLYYPALLVIKRTYDKSFYIIFNRDYMLVMGYKGTAFVSEKIEYSKIGYIMTGDNCPHRTIFGKTPEKLRRDYGTFTDVFDRKKEYLFSYAMNDDITQEIMARCKNVKEILELD